MDEIKRLVITGIILIVIITSIGMIFYVNQYLEEKHLELLGLAIGECTVDTQQQMFEAWDYRFSDTMAYLAEEASDYQTECYNQAFKKYAPIDVYENWIKTQTTP